MSRIELAPEVADDFERILDHLFVREVRDGVERIRQILDAIDVLTRNPLIGRPAGSKQRELIIGSGARGYVALYRFILELDVVLILAIRGQAEAGYAREEIS